MNECLAVGEYYRCHAGSVVQERLAVSTLLVKGPLQISQVLSCAGIGRGWPPSCWACDWLLFCLASLIGGYGKGAMETGKMSFERGSLLFVPANVLQLVGWTSLMIYDGALAAGGIYGAGGCAQSSAWPDPDMD